MSRYLGGMAAGAVVVLAAGAYLSLTQPLTRNPGVASDDPVLSKPPAASADSRVSGPGADADLVELAPRAPEADDAGNIPVEAVSEDTSGPSERPDIGAAPATLDRPETADQPEINVAAASLPAAPQSAAPLPGVAQSEDALPETGSTATPSLIEPEPTPVAPEVAAIEEATPEPQPERVLPRLAALPQIGGASDADTPSGAGTPVVPLTERDPVLETEPEPQKKPIEAHAADFDNPDQRPLMSIVLIDDEGAFGVEALRDFPHPLSFAVSPDDPEAAAKMASHRAAGFEVLAIADLPQSASAQDAEVSLAVWLDKLPETVGVLEGTATGIQGNRRLAEQVAAIAGGTGRGLVTQDSGLNSVQKTASRNGIPAAVIFRDFDGAGQETRAMRRFLDQAAFRAGQEGAVVMLGRVRPETISALLLWGLEDRADRVALAPISAVLMKDQQ